MPQSVLEMTKVVVLIRQRSEEQEVGNGSSSIDKYLVCLTRLIPTSRLL
jgi:hypothetical protein